jgi:hypothetical protein
MIARAFIPDKDDLSALNPIGIDPAKDFVVVIESDGRIVGALAWRVIGYAHQMLVEQGNPLARHICEKAIDYALGTGRALKIPDVMFITDRNNEAFRSYMKEHGADEQLPNEIVYRMGVR